MKLLRLIKHDISEGTLKCFYKFTIVIIVILAQAIILNQRIKSMMSYGIFDTSGTILDYMIYLTRGEPVYNFSPDAIFNVPIYWFAFQIGIAYIIAYYPKYDFDNYGKNSFIAVKSRTKWWISKCIWCILTVLMYYLFAFLTILAFSVLNGVDISFEITRQITKLFYSESINHSNKKMIYMVAILIPVLATIAISLFQIIFSFLLSPVLSFATVCGIYVLSAYYTKDFFIGNYTMWLRSGFVDIQGVSSEVGIVLSLLLIIGSITFGSMYFDKRDII